MRLIFAILIKHKTNDGAFEMADNVKLGKIYVVDADSIRTVMGINIKNRIPFVWRHEIISTRTGNMIPLEMIQLEENSDNLPIKQSAQKRTQNG